MNDRPVDTEAAVDVQRAWAEAFAVRDLDRLISLYADQTAFYGSTAAFYTTREGVRTYFELLPERFTAAEYQIPHIVRLSDDAVAATGEVTFYSTEGGKTAAIPYRMTHVLVRRDGMWKIATHHASPRPRE